MMNKELQIRIKSVADTGGVDKAQEAIAEVKGDAARLNEEIDARLAQIRGSAGEAGEAMGDAEGRAGNLSAAMLGAVAGVWTTAASLALSSWLRDNENAVNAVKGLFEEATTTIGDGLASMLPDGEDIAEWANSWKVQLGGMTEHMESYVVGEKDLLDKRDEQLKANTAKLKEELDKQKGLWADHRRAISDQFDELDEQAQREETLAAADDDIAKAEIDADSSLSPEQKSQKKTAVDEGARKRQAGGREASRQRRVSEAQTVEESAISQREQAAAAEAEQQAKVDAMKKQDIARQRAADAKNGAELAQADMDRAKNFPMVHRINGLNPEAVYNNAEKRKAKAEADAERYDGQAKALQQQTGPTQSLEEEQARLDALKKSREEAQAQEEAARREAEGARQKADSEGSFDRALENKRDVLIQAKQGAAASPSSAPDPTVGQAAQEAAGAAKQGASNVANDMTQLAPAFQEAFGQIQGAVGTLADSVREIKAANEQAMRTAEQALQEAKSASMGTKRFNQTAY